MLTSEPFLCQVLDSPVMLEHLSACLTPKVLMLDYKHCIGSCCAFVPHLSSVSVLILTCTIVEVRTAAVHVLTSVRPAGDVISCVAECCLICHPVV